MESALDSFGAGLVEFLDQFAAFRWGGSVIESLFAPAEGVTGERQIDILGKEFDGSEDLGEGGASLEEACGSEAGCAPCKKVSPSVPKSVPSGWISVFGK
jgi:hypothetical protein